MAAGGSEWRLISLLDASRLFQKDGEGPWFLQRHYTVTIQRKVRAQNVDVSPQNVGSKSSSITFSIGGRTLSRGVIGGSSAYFCREDRYDTIDEASNFVNQTQVWEWIEPEEDAKEI